MANDTISDIIRGTEFNSKLARRLVRDLAAASETNTYKEFRKTYKLTRAEWASVPQNETLLLKVKAERDRRSRVKKPGKVAKSNKGKDIKPELTTVSNVVELHPAERLEDNLEFVSDCCRFQEGILSEARMRMKYSFANSVWEKLADNSALLVAVEDEKIRRMRSGATKREKSQMHVMRAPDVAAKIMLDETANNRHRLDACKVLDDFSATGPTAVPPADMFHIIINLGSDTLEYRKSLKPLKPGETDPNEITPDADKGMLAAIAAREPTEDSGGGNII